MLTVGAGLLFPYCYFGERATESFEKMSDCLYESDWPYFSVDLQKTLHLMITNMSKPIRYHGFNIAFLDLRTFIAVNTN